MSGKGVDPVAHLRELSKIAEHAAEELGQKIRAGASLTQETIRAGGTIFFVGNGGSAADAQHMATEYTIRYLRERRALRAIALTTDTSALTAAGNDYGFDFIFSRQLEALGRKGDLLMVHTTSGNSPNCVKAIETAKAMGIRSIALTAKDGGKVKDLADLCLIVPTQRTDRAQEVHLAIQHAICDTVDAEVAGA